MQPLGNCLCHLATRFEIFPEGYLVAVDQHLIGGAMQFTAELDERKAIVAASRGGVLGAVTAIWTIEVVNILQVDELVIYRLDFAKVNLIVR